MTGYIIAAVVILVLFYAARLLYTYDDFRVEYTRLSMEIGRTHGTEKHHYMKKRKKLMISYFFGMKYI